MFNTATKTNPGRKGWKIKGGGHAGNIVAAPEFRGSTVQVCGLWPFNIGTASPMIGVPLGFNLLSGETVCSDPISWFHHANFIPNPSLLVTGKPGLGKSTLVRRMVTGLCAYGVTPMIFGDLKPDYRNLIKVLGGNIIELGRGRGKLNILDPGSAHKSIERLTGPRKQHLKADLNGRRLNLLASIIASNREASITDHEWAILSRCLQIIDDKFVPGEATLHDLVNLLAQGPTELQEITLSRGNKQTYNTNIDLLQRSLISLIQGALGEVFAHKTTTQIDLTKPTCIDISSLPESDQKLQSAVLLASWGEGFGSIAALQALTDAGVEPQRNFLVVMDELWRVLGSSGKMNERIDAITRLDRSLGVGTIMITHSLADITTQDGTAGTLADRMGYFAMAGQPKSEIDKVRNILDMSNAEADIVTSWVAPDTMSKQGGRNAPSGRGKILLKIGGGTGIPVQVTLTDIEQAVNNTNQKWEKKSTKNERPMVDLEHWEESGN